MWTGIAAITVIVAAIAAAIYVSFNRRVIYGPAPAEPAPAASGQRQRTDLRAARQKRSRNEGKPFQTTFRAL